MAGLLAFLVGCAHRSDRYAREATDEMDADRRYVREAVEEDYFPNETHDYDRSWVEQQYYDWHRDRWHRTQY